MKPSLIALALLSLFFAACNIAQETSTPISEATMTPEPSPTATPVPVEPVTFITEDGVTLAGTLFGKGKIAIILAHQGTPGADQTSWQPFARLLAERGYTALAFDFRGVGQSEGVLGYGDLWKDVKAAAQFLRTRGYSQIVCAGASMGGTACIYNAAREDYKGLIVLASAMTAGNGSDTLRITDDDLTKLMLPTLFITAEGDYFTVVKDMKHMAGFSSNPASLLLLPGTQHGTDLFNTESGEALTASMLEFLDGLQKQAPTPNLTIKLEGTTGPVYSLAWSPDGRALASAGYGQVKLWDGATRQEIATIEGHASYVWGLAWSPDGAVVASASQDGTVKLWDADSRENIATLHTGWAFCVSWSPDGKRLAVGTDSSKSQIWDVEANRKTLDLDGGSMTPIISIAWSSDGRTIAVGQWDGKITLWDSESGAQLKSLTATKMRSDINGLAWSPDGSRLASAHQDGKVRIWDSATWEIRETLTGHVGWLRGLAWSPDGSMLASTGEDATIRVWNVEAKQLLVRLKPDNLPTWSLAWSPDGKWLAAGNGAYESKTTGGKVLILNVQSEIFPTSENAEPPLPPLQVITTANAGKIQLLKTLQITGFKKSPLSQCSVAFSPDGKLLTGVCYENTIPVWDAQSGQLIRSLESTPTREVAVAFSADGKQIATGGFADNIRLWDSATGQLLQTIAPLPAPTWELAFSPNEDRLASANFDLNHSGASGMSLWNLSGGKLIWNYKSESMQPLVLSVDFAPDGKTIAYGTFDSALILDAETGALIQSLPIPNHVGDLAFSLDGKLLATASDDRKIRLWRTDNFELAGTLDGHAHYVNGVTFSPDGKLVVSGGHDKKVGVWDVATGQMLTMLEGHEAEVLRVAVNPSGTLIASVSWDGTVRLWGVAQ